MTQNKLSIHVESGDIFYENHNTGENFYNFSLAQQNNDAAFIPKKFAYRNSFENYISQFLQSFSIYDVENMIFTLTKIQNIYLIVLMILLKLMVIQDKKLNIPKNA